MTTESGGPAYGAIPVDVWIGFEDWCKMLERVLPPMEGLE